MSFVNLRPAAAAASLPPLLWCVPLALAAALLFAPAYAELAAGPWETDQEGHGPFVLAAGIWLVIRSLPQARELPHAPTPALGWPVFVLGLAAAVVGRSQDFLSIAVAAQIPIIAGLVLMLFGGRMLRLFAFPLAFMLFTVPVPGWAMDAVTVPLKGVISDIVTDILYALGYPVAQNGVVLMIGQYQLLVEDACSGLNSLYSLSAVSIFYIHLARHSSAVHNTLLWLAVLPVSFLANLLRVMLLVLLTYHLGDYAARGLLHDISGGVLFTAALLAIFLVDSLILGVRLVGRRVLSGASKP